MDPDRLRAARRLFAAGHRIYGFIPVPPLQSVRPVLQSLAEALVHVTGQDVAALLQEGRPGVPEVLTEGPGVVRLERFEDGLAIFRLLVEEDPYVATVAFGRALPDLGRRYPRLLVDLGGVAAESLRAAELCEGLVLVARAAKTMEADLRAAAERFASVEIVGVLLVDEAG